MSDPRLKRLGACLLAILGSAYLAQNIVPWRQLMADERTGPAQTRLLQLSDGSQLALNPATHVDIRFTAQQRRLVLHDGEVLVQASSDPRPLIVETPSGEVRAHSGTFSVDHLHRGSQVNAYAADVQVLPRLGTPSLLPSGSGLWLRRAGSSWQWPARPSRINTRAWPAGS